MKRLSFCLLAAIACCALGATQISAQQPAEQPAPTPAKFQVIPFSHNSAIMVDLTTGQSWKLEKNADKKGSFVWVPVRKLTTNMEVDEWRQRMEKARAERREADVRDKAPREDRLLNINAASALKP